MSITLLVRVCYILYSLWMAVEVHDIIAMCISTYSDGNASAKDPPSSSDASETSQGTYHTALGHTVHDAQSFSIHKGGSVNETDSQPAVTFDMVPFAQYQLAHLCNPAFQDYSPPIVPTTGFEMPGHPQDDNPGADVDNEMVCPYLSISVSLTLNE